MIIEKYNSIMEKPEAHRKKWALGFTVAISVFIFVSFAFYKGFLNFGNTGFVAQKGSERNVAAVVSADSAPSPFDSSMEVFKAGFGEIRDRYNQFKTSISDVLVPFVTGIEVYKRE